jgi:hypothetical protein
MTAIGKDCQETMAKYAEQVEKHGESHPLALDAEFAHVRCMWSRMLPKGIWNDFENCYTKSKNDRSKCQVEIEQIQLALQKEGEMVTRAMGFIPQTDYRRYGGPAAILQNLVAPVMYSAHVDDLLTEAINKQNKPAPNKK